MKISFIMHVPATPAIWLGEAIESIRKQTINSWELCLCVDNSENCENLKILNSFENNPKIRILKSNKFLGPSKANNLAVSLASSNYLAFINPNDLLPKFSVERIISKITENKNPDFLYSDEDIINTFGKYLDSDLKPDFSPEHLHSAMYMSNILVIKKSVFDNLKGFRSKYDGAHYYDLALRVSHLSKSIIHIPEKLYIRRVHDDPSLELISQHFNLEEKSFLALNDSLSKFLPVRGFVEKGLLPNTFRARFPLPKNLRTTLVIITAGISRRLKGKGKVVLINNFIQSILLKSSFKNFDLLVINNRSLDVETRNLIKSSNGDINDDLEVISDDWIEALIELLQIDKVGAVGAKLLFENNKIQHCGMSIYNSRPYTKHIFYKTQSCAVSSDKSTHLIRNFSCVTGAVLATRLSLLKMLDGFDEELPTDYNDTDFCFRLTKLDYRIVFSPHSKLYHYENSSFKRNGLSIDAWKIFYKRWKKHLVTDRFFNEKIDRKSDKYFKSRVDKLLKKVNVNNN
jgi:GT2 family glycosyltransferase